MTGTGLSLGNHTSFFFDRNLKTSPSGAPDQAALGPGSLSILLDRDAFAACLLVGPDCIRDGALRINAPFRLRKRCVETALVLGDPVVSKNTNELKTSATSYLSPERKVRSREGLGGSWSATSLASGSCMSILTSRGPETGAGTRGAA